MQDRYDAAPIEAQARQHWEAIDAYKTVEDTQTEMEQLRSDFQTRVALIEADARGRIQVAIKEAQTERERIISEARALADTAVKNGAADLEREKQESLHNLQETIVSLAMKAAGKALGNAGNTNALQNSIEAHIKQRYLA